MNAGAFPRGEFHACDFNPEHVEGGAPVRERAGARRTSQFHEASFERLLDEDLPPFDFIVLHGVYSWVGADARAAIRRIIQEKLASGGLVYVELQLHAGMGERVAGASRCSSSSRRRRAGIRRRRCGAPLSCSRR